MSSNPCSQTISFGEFSRAMWRFIPKLPRFMCALWTLSRAKKHHRGSTGYYLQLAAQRYPQRLFLKTQTATYTYTEFNQWVNRLAQALMRYGIKRQECVGLMFQNSAEQLAWAFAINKIGAVAGMLNPKQHGDVLAHSIAVIKPKLIIAADEFYEVLRPYAELAPQAFTGQPKNGDVNLAELTPTPPCDNPDITATITLGENCYYVLTSGTTGLPKAAAMTHLRWYKAGVGFGRMTLALTERDTLYSTLPLSHNTALSIALSATVITGSCLAIAERFSASLFWQEVQHFNATCFVYVGELCRYLLQQPTHPDDGRNTIRAVIGNGLRPELWDEFQQRFNIPAVYELYGASEGNAGFVNAFNLKCTVGFSPMTYAIVRFDHDNETPLRDAHGRLQKVKKGEVGLLLTQVSPKAPFDGYTNNPQANQEKLFQNVFKKGDCWFNTGDLVRHQGFRHIAFIDRIGDTFRWKSENVATTEVEAYVSRFHDVLEAVVYGVKVPNAEGRAGMVSLVLNHGREFNPQAFYQYIRDKLPDYALPRFVRLRSAHELTSTFKVMKAQLKQESFSLSQITDPLYVLIDEQQGYQPLTNSLYQAIKAGHVSLR